MTIYESFFETYDAEIIDPRPVSESIIKKYENTLPKPIIDMWKKHGFCGYDEGLFWTINPDEYIEFLKRIVETNREEILPIMRTAFGDIIIIYKTKKVDPEYNYIGFKVIDMKHSNSNTITIGLEDFFKNYLINTGRLMGATNIDGILFLYGRGKLKILKSDECYGFEPILALGGKERKENMKVLNYNAHLEILTQALKEKIEVI